MEEYSAVLSFSADVWVNTFLDKRNPGKQGLTTTKCGIFKEI